MIKMAFIPARYAATRFPFKLMQKIGNKTVISHTYENTLATGLFDEVIVVTDHKIIFGEILSRGGKVMMSEKTHESGSDRIAEAIQNINVDVIVNVQGDEPFVQKEPIEKLLQVFEGEAGMQVKVASLMRSIDDEKIVTNPNIVKLVTDIYNDALYFSRNVIPFSREKNEVIKYKEHVGVYAYRKEVLQQYTSWPPSHLEQIEKLEQLRYLEHGIKIKMVETDAEFIKIDVPEDLVKAQEYYALLQKEN